MEASGIKRKVEAAFEKAAGGRRNVGETERWISLLGGGALILYGLKRRSWPGLALALLGGGMAYRGATGHCPVYQSLDINTFEEKKEAFQREDSIRIEKSILIPQKTVDELYRFWRQVENLPRIMTHLESVREKSDNRSHWIAKAAIGTELDWEAEIADARENEQITWRAAEEGDADNIISVRFEKAPGEGGTWVRLLMEYHPRRSLLGAAFAKLFGEEPGKVLEETLARFKEVIETPGAPTQAA